MNEFQSTQSDQQNLVLVPFMAFYLYCRIFGAQIWQKRVQTSQNNQKTWPEMDRKSILV